MVHQQAALLQVFLLGQVSHNELDGHILRRDGCSLIAAVSNSGELGRGLLTQLILALDLRQVQLRREGMGQGGCMDLVNVVTEHRAKNP